MRGAVALVLAVTALRLVSLLVNRTDLYFDEAQYWTWAQDPDFGYYSKPPLIAWVIAATTALFGDEEWAVRLAAPLFHGGTALLLLVLGQRLHGGRVGALAAVLYLLLPAVSLSSGLISTDVPLLFFWAAALVFVERLLRRDDLMAAVGLGASIAVGLNAKYAMAFLPPLILVALAADRGLRPRLASPRLWLAFGIGLLGFLPNLVWNLRHDFVTFAHTGDNAGWQGRLSPTAAAEFLGSQFGVFGPILFLGLVLALAGRWRSARPRTDRLLLWLSVPVIAAIAVQALLSRANANWAATAYPAATVLLAALLAEPGRAAAARWTHALHGVVAAVLIVAPAFAPEIRLPLVGRPFERLLGWKDFAVAVASEAERTGARTIVVERRPDAAALSYHLRHEAFAIAVPAGEGPPRDHYQMTRPFRPDLPSPGLLVVPSSSSPEAAAWRATGPTVQIRVGRGVLKREPMTATPIRW